MEHWICASLDFNFKGVSPQVCSDESQVDKILQKRNWIFYCELKKKRISNRKINST